MEQKRSWIPYLQAAPLTLVFAAFFALPIALVVVVSFFDAFAQLQPDKAHERNRRTDITRCVLQHFGDFRLTVDDENLFGQHRLFVKLARKVLDPHMKPE